MPPELSEPAFVETSLQIVSARVAVDCSRDPFAGGCDVEARYRVRNHAHLAVTSRGSVVARIVTHPPSGKKLVAPVVSVDGVPVPTEREPDRWSFELAFDAEASRELVVRASFVQRGIPHVFGGGACTVEAILERHELTGAGTQLTSYAFHYTPRTRDPEITVRLPPGFGSSTDREPPIDGSTDKPSFFAVSIWRERGAVWNGGPYFGLGWSFSSNGGPRVRTGYEIAAPYWLFHSLSAESDLSRQLAIVPAVEAVKSGPIALGAGAGLPIRVQPDLRAGARVQGSASLGRTPVVVRGSIDLYPKTATSPLAVEGTLGAQLSF